MLGYRAFFEVKPASSEPDLHEMALSQVRSWLNGRRNSLDVDLMGEGITEFNETTRAVLLRRVDDRNADVTTRFRLTEQKPEGLWVTDLLVRTSLREPGWIRLDVHDPQSGAEEDSGVKRWTAVPGIARYLLETVSATDGQLSLTSEPISLGIDDIETYHDILMDEARRSLAVFAGSDRSIDQVAWRGTVSAVFKDAVGQAGVYFLTPELTAEVNRLMPEHQIPAGGFRLAYPGTDPAVHPRSQGSLAIWPRVIQERGEHRVGRRIGWLARERQLAAPIPREVLRVERVMDDFEQERVLTLWVTGQVARPLPASPDVKAAQDLELEKLIRGNSLTPNWEALEFDTPRLTPDLVGVLESLREGVRRLVGETYSLGDGLDYLMLLAEETEEAWKNSRSLERTVDDTRKRLTDTREEVDRLTLLLEEGDEERADVEQRLDGAEDKVRYLQRRLRDANLHADAYAEVPQDQVTKLPSDFEELLLMMGDLTNLRFVGSENSVLELNNSRGRANVAGKAFKGLLALNDFVQSKIEGVFSGSFATYVKNTPEGYRAWSAERQADHESETTGNSKRLSFERTFVVPGVGPVYMESHLKVTKQRSISPRIHYYDASELDRLVYIGYVGPHLALKGAS